MNKEKQIELERWEIAKIMADNFHINGEGWDDSDFEWTAHCLQMEGYRKQSNIIDTLKAIDKFRDKLMDKFLSLCNYDDYNKLTLLTIGESIDKIYDECIADIVAKMKGGAE